MNEKELVMVISWLFAGLICLATGAFVALY